MTKHYLTALAVAASAAAAGSAYAQAVPDAKIAVVDTQRLLSDCTACKAANTQLQTQQAQIRTSAQALAAPLETEAKALQAAVTAAKGNPDAALQARITAYQTKQQAAQQQVGAQEQTLQRNAAFVNQQIGEKARPIIQQIAQQRGATLAIDKGSTIYSTPAIEITDAVLAQLNTQLPSVSTTAPAAPAGTRPASTQGR